MQRTNSEYGFPYLAFTCHFHITKFVVMPVKFDSHCCRMVALQRTSPTRGYRSFLWASNRHSYGYQPYLLSNTIWLATASIISNLSLLLTTWRDKYSCFKQSKPNWLFRSRVGDFRLSQLCLHPGHCLESLCACTLLCWTNASRHCRTCSPYWGTYPDVSPLALQNCPLLQLDLCVLKPDGGDHASDFLDSVPMVPTFASSLSGRP